MEPSLAARTSQLSALSTGSCSRYYQRSVTSLVARVWVLERPATGTSSALQSSRCGPMFTEPGRLSDAYWETGKSRASCGRSRCSTEVPHTRLYSLLVMNAVIRVLPPRCLSSDTKRTGDQPDLYPLRYLTG